MSQEDIEKQYKKLYAKSIKANRELYSFVDSIKSTCTHSIKKESQRDRDDGYGKWWVEKYHYCEICGKANV